MKLLHSLRADRQKCSGDVRGTIVLILLRFYLETSQLVGEDDHLLHAFLDPVLGRVLQVERDAARDPDHTRLGMEK